VEKSEQFLLLPGFAGVSVPETPPQADATSRNAKTTAYFLTV
jgi:hypothetical protein